MEKVYRAGMRMRHENPAGREVGERSGPLAKPPAAHVTGTLRQLSSERMIQDALGLIMRAERSGFPRSRVEVLRREVARVPKARLEGLMTRLRGWLDSHRSPPSPYMTVA